MARAGWLALAVAAAALPLLTANTYYLYLGASTALLVIVAAGLNVLVGFTGQISLGHAGFYAIGAYAAALAAMRGGWPLWAAAIVAIAAAALVGALVAAAALRVTGPYLAMVTIAFGIIVEGVLVEWVAVTGGPGGIFNIPKISLARYYWVVAAAAALALWATANLRRSPWGRAFLAVKGSEVAAESLGLSPYHLRIVAFTVSAAFTGGAGALFAFLNGYISPDSFSLQQSILFLLALLFGGVNTIAGPVVGGLVLTLLPELLTRLADYRLILYGLLLLLSIYWLPRGLVGALVRGTPLPERRRGQAEGEQKGEGEKKTDGEENEETRAPETLLHLEHVTVRFGGVAALNDVSLSVPSRGISAIMGPNGAGKTTLLNILSGYYRPDAGLVTLRSSSIGGRPPHAIARLGVARTFQTSQLFGELTVADNVAVGLAGPRLGSLLGALVGLPAIRRRERSLYRASRERLATHGLDGLADAAADALAAGLRRRLEIVRALATGPRLLLLDEPAAGLTPSEVAELDAALAALRGSGGPAMVLVEHHMDLVMAISDHVVVLDGGRLIAQGAPAAVQRDPAVIEAYLGTVPA
jgi:ABC-type branched-subunit amino acid transport system ATPase component/ABC-type branched-subunit amino acid transport system permease subunit